MSLLKGFSCAIGCGAVAGALWVGLAAATGWEFTLVAIVLGGATGFGMGMACKGSGGPARGALAAVAALVCILGAKVGVANIIAQRWIASQKEQLGEEDAREALRSSVLDEFVQGGVAMSEPEDEDSYPPEVWTEADRRWHAMSLAERDAYLGNIAAQWEHDAQAASGVATVLAFVLNFGLFDFVCVGLALSTAYKGGSHRIGPAADEEGADTDAPAAPAMFRAGAAQVGAADPVPLIKPAASRPPTPETAPATAGLGIFAMLGSEPPAPARSVLPEPPRSQGSSAVPALPEEQGLINIDLGDGRAAA